MDHLSAEQIKKQCHAVSIARIAGGSLTVFHLLGILYPLLAQMNRNKQRTVQSDSLFSIIEFYK